MIPMPVPRENLPLVCAMPVDVVISTLSARSLSLVIINYSLNKCLVGDKVYLLIY